jgi:HEPN domain-containing protein
MSDEARAWLCYAEENLQSAQLLLQNAFFNPALQHAQQAMAKFLKAVLIARDIPLQRTHSIKPLERTAHPTGFFGLLRPRRG